MPVDAPPPPPAAVKEGVVLVDDMLIWIEKISGGVLVVTGCVGRNVRKCVKGCVQSLFDWGI